MNEAITIFEKAIIMAKNDLGEYHSFLGELKTNLAVTYSRLGQYKEAISLHKSAIAIFDKLNSTDKSIYISTLCEIASTYYELENTDSAFHYIQLAKLKNEGSRNKNKKKFNAIQILFMENQLHNNLGNYEEALMKLNDILEIMGSDSVNSTYIGRYLRVVNSIGTYYTLQKRYDKALIYFNKLNILIKNNNNIAQYNMYIEPVYQNFSKIYNQQKLYSQYQL